MFLQIINKLLSKRKGSSYELDRQIPSLYLANMLFSRFLMIIRGKFSFIDNGGMLFLAKGVRIKCKSKLKVGYFVSLGNNVFIDALSINGVILGNNVSIGRNCRIEATGNFQQLGKGMKVGDNVGLGADCFYGCAGGIEIGNDTIIGNLVTFHSENHVTEDLEIPIRLQGVKNLGIVIKDNCWIGAKATVLDGVTLESGCIIAAGAVLIAGTYKKNGIYGGVPAKLLKYRYE